MPEMFKIDPEVAEARDELKENLRGAIGDSVLKHGREITTHALRKVYAEFSANRYVNPYPTISDGEFDQLVELTNGNRFPVGDMSPEECAQFFREHHLEKIDLGEIEAIYRENGDEMLYAYVDLSLADLFVEERTAYVEAVLGVVLDELPKP